MAELKIRSEAWGRSKRTRELELDPGFGAYVLADKDGWDEARRVELAGIAGGSDIADIRDWDPTAGTGNDDSAAFAGAAASGQMVRVPVGTYNCDSAACTTHVPGSGLIGDTVGKVRQQEASDKGATIIWNGTGFWWQMAKQLPSGGAEGGHTFENLTFRCSDADGSLFDWPSDTSNILRNVSYRQCIFLGPNLPGEARSSIAIRGRCLFEMSTDWQCFFYAFARAIELDGCDNTHIGGKFQTNTQHLRILATDANFGNYTRVSAVMISTGSVGIDGDEFCHIYNDDGNDLSLDGTWFENADGLGFIYHNGKSLTGWGVKFGNNTGEDIITLGPLGKDATLVAPYFKDGGGAYPIVSEAWAQQSSSGASAPFTLTLVAPNQVWHERGTITGALGRVRVVDPARPEKSFMPPQNTQIGARGVGIRNFMLTPLDLQFGTIPSGSPAIVEADSSAFSGLTWKLLKDSPYSDLRMRLKVGWHIQNGDSLFIYVRHKAAGAVSSGTLRYSVQLNGSNATNGALIAGTTSYISDSRAYVLAGAVAGDSLDIGVYTDTGSVDQDCYVEAIEVVVLPSMNSDMGAPNDLTDAAVSLSWGNTPQYQRLNVPITANRTATLNTNTIIPGAFFHFYRTLAATGNFLLRIGSPTLINLSPGDWCRVRVNAALAWELIASGTSWLTTQTAAAQDATPSVLGMRTLITANASATTITALDDGAEGQEVLVQIADANTTIDFTGTTLKGNAGVDWTPANGDFMRCRKIGSSWYCTVTDATA